MTNTNYMSRSFDNTNSHCVLSTGMVVSCCSTYKPLLMQPLIISEFTRSLFGIS